MLQTSISFYIPNKLLSDTKLGRTATGCFMLISTHRFQRKTRTDKMDSAMVSLFPFQELSSKNTGLISFGLYKNI